MARKISQEEFDKSCSGKLPEELQELISFAVKHKLKTHKLES